MTVKADLGPERGTLAWEADGHQNPDTGQGKALTLHPLSLPPRQG